MSGEILIIIALVVVLVIMIAFIEIRDREINKRLDVFGKIIEDLNKQNHELNKKVNDHLFGNIIITKADKDKIDERVENEVQNKIMPLKKSLKEVELITKEFQEKQKQFPQEPNGIQEEGDIDLEQQVINLFDAGKNQKEIASVLNLDEGEVEFILDLNERITDR